MSTASGNNYAGVNSDAPFNIVLSTSLPQYTSYQLSTIPHPQTSTHLAVPRVCPRVVQCGHGVVVPVAVVRRLGCADAVERRSIALWMKLQVGTCVWHTLSAVLGIALRT